MPGYPARTEVNVRSADLTVIFTARADRPPSGGTQLTVKLCRRLKKSVLVNPSAEQIRALLRRAKTVNVAGPRGSKLRPQRADEIRQVLREAFRAEP
jgi:hypothetical protein